MSKHGFMGGDVFGDPLLEFQAAGTGFPTMIKIYDIGETDVFGVEYVGRGTDRQIQPQAWWRMRLGQKPPPASVPIVVAGLRKRGASLEHQASETTTTIVPTLPENLPRQRKQLTVDVADIITTTAKKRGRP